MFTNKLLAALNRNPKGVEVKRLRSELRLKRSERPKLAEELRLLQKQGLVRTAGGRVMLTSKRGLVQGRFVTTGRGFGFVIPADGGADVFVPARFASGVLHGDEVEVLVNEKGRFEKPEGKVVRVVRRARTALLGVYTERGGAPFIRAFDTPTQDELPLKHRPSRQLKPGMLIEADRDGLTVTKVFGFPDEPGVDARFVASRFGLDQAFPPAALKEAAAMPAAVSTRGLRGRADFRGWATVTIDGEKARDFDDAVSVRRIGQGRVLLGVHIADVSHYVREGSELDLKAYRRATSVYFPDLTLPMLPERLSNDLCSLRPGVNRLAVSVLMEIDPRGRVLKSTFTPSIIRTAARMTYASVYRILQGDREERAAYKGLVGDLLLMKEVADKLRQGRFEDGSLDFDLVEPELIYEAGKLKAVAAAERNDAHRLIEEFMVAANVAVASRLARQGLPLIYRVHPAPAQGDLEKLRTLLAALGYRLPDASAIKPHDLQRVLDTAAGKPEEKFVTIQVLRAMKLATYSPMNVGHFGLAKTHYAHFTSPIRRYPDLVVHRILKEALEVGRAAARPLEAMASHCTERERNADAAEQNLLEWRIFRFLKERLGEEFTGVVVDMNKAGLMVELDDYFVEGLLPFGTPPAAPRAKAGRKAGTRPEKRQRFNLGDRVRVVLVSCDPAFRRMTFVPAGAYLNSQR